MEDRHYNGFFDPQTRQNNSRRLYATHRPWFDCIVRINKVAMELCHAFKGFGDTEQLTAAWSLFIRTIFSVEAGTMLVEIGLVTDARSIVRTATETVIVLRALIGDPEIINKLELREARAQCKRLTELLTDTGAKKVIAPEYWARYQADLAAWRTQYPDLPDAGRQNAPKARIDSNKRQWRRCGTSVGY